MKLENKNNKILDDLNTRNENWEKLDGIPERVTDLETNQETIKQETELKANKQQEAWITPTLLNGWTGNLQYMKDNMGSVFLMGSVSGGLDNTVVFTLPVGYRPQIIMQFINRYGASTVYSYYIHTNGALILRYMGVGDHYLNGVCFKAKEV